MIRAVIAEDEDLAARHLERLVGEHESLELVGIARDGREAIDLLHRERPDVVFLDVSLPVLDGLQVLRALDFDPYVVFTTAYDAHAVTAFQLGALDYLLKPFTDDRFHEAVARIARATDVRTGTASIANKERVGETLETRGHLQRLFVRDRDAVRVVPVDEIERAEADGDYTALFVGGRRLLAFVSLNALNERLNPDQFLRIHRSHLVNLNFVAAMQWFDGARLQIQMRDGTKILASRTRSKELRRLIL